METRFIVLDRDDDYYGIFDTEADEWTIFRFDDRDVAYGCALQWNYMASKNE